MPRLRDQDRAQAAREAVEAARRQLGEKSQHEYGQELKQLPSRILASGLGQTLAFYASKGNEGVHGKIGSQLAAFLTAGQARTTVELLDRVMADAGGYRQRTREALAYAEWLKRYAAALIKEMPKALPRSESRA
jgi:CRISPR type III-B/RAMP module-associated protein Cmr5